MGDRKPTSDELIDRLYGVGPDGPLAPEDQARLDAMSAVRRESAAGPEVSPVFLMQQRQRIFARLGQRRPAWRLRFASAGVLAAALALGVVWFKPQTAPATVVMSTPEADARLFEEMAALAEQEEPRAGLPAPDYDAWQ